MILRLKALRSLRWNYKRRGVWVWLKGRQRPPGPRWQKPNPVANRFGPCPCCGRPAVRGYQRILTEPQKVLDEQTAMAEGVFV